jgi:predicted restriction endonuclease
MWVDADHLVNGAQGGATELDNLVLLCRHHHWCVHEGGWTLVHAHDDSKAQLERVLGR